MKTTGNLDALPLAQDVRLSKNGHATEFIFPPPKADAPNREFPNRLLLAAVFIMAMVFVWVCWNFVHAPQTPSSKPLLAVIGSLAVCLLASAAAGAVFWSRHTASESVRLAEVNARLAKERDLLRMV